MARRLDGVLTLRFFRLLTWLETLLCPEWQYQKVLEYSLWELDCMKRPDPFRRYVRDCFQHLRRHGAIPLLGGIILGLGTALYTLVNASALQDIIWPAAGLGMVIGLPAIIPKVEPVRGGCPYLLENQPPRATPLHIRPWLTGTVGAVVVLTALVMPLRHLVFDLPAMLGAVVGGVAILVLAVASYRRNSRMHLRALRITALAALLLGFGNAGWGFFDASHVADTVASITSGVGALIYALAIGDLLRCFGPPGTAPGITGFAIPGSDLDIDEQSA